MEDQIVTNQLSIQEIAVTGKSCEEHRVDDAQRDDNIPLSTSPSRKPLGNEQRVSQAAEVPWSRSDFIRIYNECSELESPLKGTPWEDAGWNPIASRRNRKPRREKSKQEEECVAFWLKFFG